jgi:lysozyme
MKRLLGLAVAVALLIAGPTIAYLTGAWIPAEPGHGEYPIRGIDISRHQGDIDWRQVAASGISFVYLKATEGGDFQDAAFGHNLRDARAAGLACGAYHFFSLRTPGAVQAENFLKTAPKDQLALPPAVDLEYWGNSSARPKPEDFQRELRIYLEAITQAYGREPVIYTAPEFSDVYLKGFTLTSPWVRSVLFPIDRTQPWTFWQFTEKARVPGIHRFVDEDVFHGDGAEFERLLAH